MATAEQEFAAVQKRYGAVIDLPSVLVDIHPSGHTVVPLPSLPVQLSVPDSYPEQPVSVNVLPNAHLPPPIVKALTLLVQQYIRTTQWSGKPMIRTLLRWLESHVDELLNEIVSIQKEAAAAAQAKATPAAALDVASGSDVEPSAPSAPALEAAVASMQAESRTFSDGSSYAFAGQDAWTVDMHVRFEHAVFEFLHERQRSRTDLRTWTAVAELVNVTGQGRTVTAAQCLARFILLQKVTQQWHQTCVAPFRSGSALFPSAPIIPAPAPVPAPGQSEAQRQAQRDASKQQGDRTVQPSKRKQHVSQPMGMHSLGDERVPFPISRREERERALAQGQDEDEEEEDTDKKNPLHVRLYKYFGQPAAAEEDENEEGEEAAGDDQEGEDDDDEEEDEGGQGADAEAEEGEGDEEDAEEEDNDDSHIAAFKGIHLDAEHKGYQVLLDRLSLYGIGTCATSRAHVNVQCTRCALVLTADLGGATLQKDEESSAAPAGSVAASGGGASGSGSGVTMKAARVEGNTWSCWCPKCSLLLSCTLRPTLLHDGAAALGYVDCQNGVVSSLASTWLIATCLECGAPIASPRLSPPVTWETSCHHCYGRIRLEAKGADVQYASADNADRAPAVVLAHSHGKGKAGGSRLQGITPGKPLPDEGTCKHYKQSYRWLRFPCCDQAFACDACHDDKSDHPAEWAKRMICGHCAREQPFSNAACVACGGSMRKSTRRSTFWEGGDGQRNRSLLSKKDSRKYANSKLKTRSKKDERVGTAGASAHSKEKGKTYERYRLVMINGKQTGIVETVTTKPKQVRK